MPRPDPSTRKSVPLSAPRGHDPLDRLRALRARPERARDLGEDMLAQMKTLRKVSRTESALHAAWSTAAPDHLAGSCTPVGLKAGKLEIIAPNASVRFQLDRWLRSGGQAELSALARVPIAGVRVRIGSKP